MAFKLWCPAYRFLDGCLCRALFLPSARIHKVYLLMVRWPRDFLGGHPRVFLQTDGASERSQMFRSSWRAIYHKARAVSRKKPVDPPFYLHRVELPPPPDEKSGGRRGARTPKTFRPTGFQDRRFHQLSHPSKRIVYPRIGSDDHSHQPVV